MSYKRAKPRSVLKVVQIFNPTIIRTDAASFRELVQELTGMNYQPAIARRSGKLRSKSFRTTKLIQSNTAATTVIDGNRDQSAAPAFSDEAGLAPYSPNWSDKSCEEETSSSGANFDDMDMDIISALLDSSRPLPDCTMLPPLIY
ncbi:hypothetical protein SELMODRAFT_138089 [Selaginella moellendorffii]|uniref:VQ domain-containing protein n=1 Tax=Selaginella moellendorffii TaxID=88036 RepID=D8TEN6_SELML|nr:hypothetical protein SELMODRAFT_138089 [Selaginella moellendorffii]